MEDGGLMLTLQDRDRLVEIRGVMAGNLTQREAARRLGLGVRQVKRLVASVRRRGDRGIVHGLRGRRSNRRLAEATRAKAVAVLSRPEYRGFGPTLGAEHLARGSIRVSKETLRKWMSQESLWRPRKARVQDAHVWRERRACFGELVQMDTSEHDWLEGRGPKLYLIAMIDDATSRLLARFAEHDSTEENLGTLKLWLEQHGRPVALYSDKGSVFATSKSPAHIEKYGPPPPTSFGEALSELGIRGILAHSPQAKGRIERSFQTLQDRLTKELRVAGVCGLEEANRFLNDTFLPDWQARFTKSPRRPRDAHRPLGGLDLDSILCAREERTVTADYTVMLGGRRWAVRRRDVVPGLRGVRVITEQRLDGSVWLRLRHHRIPTYLAPAAAPAASGLSGITTPRHPRGGQHLPKPAANHPWRRRFKGTLLRGGRGDISTLP